MREFTSQEIVKLGREIKEAKMKVLNNWGFTYEEISKMVDVPESICRTFLKTGKYSDCESSTNTAE